MKWFKRFKGLGVLEIKNPMVCYYLKTDSRTKTAFLKLYKVFNLSKYKKGNFSMVNFIKVLFEKF